MGTASKILTYQQLVGICAQLHRDHQRIVLVTGVFDLLHRAHREFLDRAKQQGDLLLAGLERDQRVRQMKGAARPVHPLATRLTQIAACHAIDYTFPLPEAFDTSADYEALIAVIRPHILAVSAHTLHQDKKKQLVEKYGGKVRVVMEKDPRISTTQLLEHRNKLQEVA